MPSLAPSKITSLGGWAAGPAAAPPFVRPRPATIALVLRAAEGDPAPRHPLPRSGFSTEQPFLCSPTRGLWSVVCGLLLMSVLFCDGEDVAASEVQAGVAHETFLLPRLVPLAGYSRRHGKPSRGMHDPVGVRALIIRDEDTTAALVSCDLLIVDERLFQAVRERLRSHGLP